MFLILTKTKIRHNLLKLHNIKFVHGLHKAKDQATKYCRERNLKFDLNKTKIFVIRKEVNWRKTRDGLWTIKKLKWWMK
jgi:hypothetical protein